MEKLHMQWSEIMNMNVYDFQNVLSSFSGILEERRKDEEEEMKKHGYDASKMNPDYMMGQAQKNMPKVTSDSLPKAPKININIPKF